MEIEKVHPELRAATRLLRVPDASSRLARAALRLVSRILPVPRTESVRVSPVRSADLRLRVYRPQTRRHRGGLLWFHGGGLLYGDARQDEALCAGTARDLGITVVSANYRFAPEHPFPAAHDDVHAAWRWVLANAAALNIDPARMIIGGESAGAGLAAALVQRIHDDGGVQPIAQWLFAPMIDDRTAADTSLGAVDHWVWNNRANRIGWGGYLPKVVGTDMVGKDAGGMDAGGMDAGGMDTVPPYAAAARRTDLSGLPPAYLAVGDIDLFCAEAADYARRLDQAGVPVRFDLVPGAPHGFENWGRSTEPAQALLARARGWLAEVFGAADTRTP